MVDYDANLIAVAAEVPNTERATAILTRIDRYWVCVSSAYCDIGAEEFIMMLPLYEYLLSEVLFSCLHALLLSGVAPIWADLQAYVDTLLRIYNVFSYTHHIFII